MAEKPVIASIQQWLSEPYFVGSVAHSLRPFWREKLIQYFTDPEANHEFLFTGSQRIGKSYIACVIIMRYIYESYYYSVTERCHLDASTLPKIIFFSFSREKADSTGIQRLIRLIDSAPWFSSEGRHRRPVQSFVEFPWIAVFSGVTEAHATGEDLLGAILDEANIRHTAKDQQLAEAQHLFTEIVARSYTTFSWGGKWFGFSGLLSTAGTQSSFVDMKLQEALLTGNRFVVRGSIYGYDPGKFSKEKFDVFIGNGDIGAFVVDSCPDSIKTEIRQQTGLTVEQFVLENEKYIEKVPVTLKRFYLEDISYALPNLSGITQASTLLLFKKKKEIDKMFNKALPRPVNEYMPFIGIYDDFDVSSYFDEEVLLRDYHGEKVYGHNDISLRNDRTGISLVFYNEETHHFQTLWWSFLYYDRSIPDNEIDQVKIVLIYKYLISIGVKFGKVTADQYASPYVLQQLKLALGKDKVDRLSVDEDATQYLNMLNLARTGMYECYEEPLARLQLAEVIYDKQTNKVDHPHNSDPVGKGVTAGGIFYDGPRYGKDILDGLTGATWNCLLGENLSLEDLLVQYKVEAKKEAPDPDDFYVGLAEEDDGFYSKLGTDEDNDELYADEEIEQFQDELYNDIIDR